MSLVCQLLVFSSDLFTIYAFCFSFGLWHTYAQSHLTGVQKGRISARKIGQILLKEVLLRINFQHEAHLYANCLFYIHYFCFRYLLFQFLSRGIRTKLPFRGVQNGQISSSENGQNMLQMYILS